MSSENLNPAQDPGRAANFSRQYEHARGLEHGFVTKGIFPREVLDPCGA